MNRTRRSLCFATLTAYALGAVGCTQLATLMYVVNGESEIPAEYADLKEKRVAVVCRPVVSLQYRYAGVDKDIAKRVRKLLHDNIGQNKKKIDMVDQRDVQRWIDEHDAENIVALGQAVKADVVVAIDLERFSLYDGSTLYRGVSDCNLTVYDIKNKGEVLWEKHPPRVQFPPNTSVPTSERTEVEFRNNFIQSLSESIAKHFYGHPISNEYAKDGNY